MNGNPWTDQEVQALKNLYPHHSGYVVSKVLGRCQSSIFRKAAQFGLKKTTEYLESDRSGRFMRGKQLQAIMQTQFKPGQAPWNKGKKGSTGTHEKSRAHHFKKGGPPCNARNYKPIGSHRVTRDGYLERKVTDDRSLAPSRRWKPVHRLVWEAAHGPIPHNHVVTFRPGQRSNVLELITLDRLELITRKEHLTRNTQQHPELKKLHQLRGAITRQVNRIKKQQDATA